MFSFTVQWWTKLSQTVLFCLNFKLREEMICENCKGRKQGVQKVSSPISVCHCHILGLFIIIIRTILLRRCRWSCAHLSPSPFQNVPYWQVWWDASRVLLNFITQTLSTLYRLTWRTERSALRISGSWNVVKNYRWRLTHEQKWNIFCNKDLGWASSALDLDAVCVKWALSFCVCVCLLPISQSAGSDCSYFLSVYLVKFPYLSVRMCAVEEWL